MIINNVVLLKFETLIFTYTNGCRKYQFFESQLSHIFFPNEKKPSYYFITFLRKQWNSITNHTPKYSDTAKLK
jgi:hypothetical protein